MQLTISVNKLLDTARLVLLGLMLFYMLCFQYAFQEIGGALPVLGVLLLGLEVLRFQYLSYYKNIAYILLFVLLSMALGLVFALDVNAHMSLAVDMLQLCIPMVCICGYVGRSEARFRQILHIISISALVLAVTLFVKGEQSTYYGSVTVGGLNTNTFAGFLLLGLLAQLFILSSRDLKPLARWLLIAAIVAELIAQLQVASRRGVVVFVFMLVTYVHTVIFICYKKKPIYKLASIFLVLCGVVVLFASFSELAENFVVFQRLLGKFTVGDANRDAFRALAWEMFLESPIVGQGFGAVASTVGASSHAMLFEVLASTGIVGAVVLFVPIIGPLLYLARKSVTAQDASVKMGFRTMAWGVVSMLLSVFVASYIYDADFYLLTGLWAAWRNVAVSKQGDTSNLLCDREDGGI